MIKIRMEGKAETEADLDKVGKPSKFKEPVQTTADFIKNMLTEYPPYGGAQSTPTGHTQLKSKPGSKYQRTGQLARGWKYRTREYVRSWAAFITNDVPYSIYVQGDEQTGVHKGFWRTTSSVMKDAERMALKKYNQSFLFS